MKIRNTKIAFIIKPNRNIRQEIFNYENILKDSFKVPFINNNIPDEAQPNIVRFYSTSLNLHSNIQVAQNKIILDTTFDNGFDDNFQLGYEYIKNKISLIKQLVHKEEIKYIGIMSFFDFEMPLNNVLPFIKELTNFSIIDNNIKELKYYYSKIYNTDYIANINISQFTRLQGIVHSTQLDAPFKMKIDSQGIQVTIDINNKLTTLDESKKNYIHSFDSLLDNYSKLIQSNELQNFIKGDLI